MGVDELAVLPALGLFTHLEAVQHLLSPFRIVAEMHRNAVVLIEDGDASVQISNEELRPLDVEVSWETHVVDNADRLALQR